MDMDIDSIERIAKQLLEQFKKHHYPTDTLCMVIHPNLCKGIAVDELVGRTKIPLLITPIAPPKEFMLIQSEEAGEFLTQPD